MITGLIVLEGNVIKFSIGEDCNACELTVSDSFSGQVKTVKVNNEQLGAIIGTAICDTNEAVLTAASPLVKQIIDESWSTELNVCPL